MGTDHEAAFLQALRSVGLTKAGDPPYEETTKVETTNLATEHGTTFIPDPPSLTPASLWRHPDAHPIVLDFLLLQKYGPDWMGWESETLEVRIPQDFNTPTLSDLNLSKVQALKTMHLVDSYWQRWEVFTWCTMPFNRVFPDFSVMQVPTLAQCLVSVDIANRIRNDVEFSLELKTYLTTVYQHDGILLPLPPIDFVLLDTSEIDVDMGDLRSRWSILRSSDSEPKGDTMEDEQLRRLLSAQHFLEESRTRLRHQLKLIPHA